MLNSLDRGTHLNVTATARNCVLPREPCPIQSCAKTNAPLHPTHLSCRKLQTATTARMYTALSAMTHPPTKHVPHFNLMRGSCPVFYALPCTLLLLYILRKAEAWVYKPIQTFLSQVIILHILSHEVASCPVLSCTFAAPLLLCKSLRAEVWVYKPIQTLLNWNY